MKSLVAVLALFVAMPLLGAQKTIAVTFEITKEHEYDTYNAAQKKELAATVVKQVSEILHSAFPIFDFAASGGNSLAIVLRDQPSSMGVASPVELAIRMDPAVHLDDDPFVVELRTDAMRSEPFANGHVGLANEILTSISRGVTKHRDDFVTLLFHRIDVTNDIFPLKRAFALPFTAAQYSIDTDSRFVLTLFENDPNDTGDFVTKPAGEVKATPDDPPIPARFVSRLRTTLDEEATKQSTLLTRFKEGGSLKPTRVVLKKYLRIAERPGIGQVPPSAANIGGKKG